MSLCIYSTEDAQGAFAPPPSRLGFADLLTLQLPRESVGWVLPPTPRSGQEIVNFVSALTNFRSLLKRQGVGWGWGKQILFIPIIRKEIL